MSLGGPGWQERPDRPGIFVHVDRPDCPVEILLRACADCGLERLTYHAVCGCPDHGTATQEERAAHARCSCGGTLERVDSANAPEPGG
jgi:hypothetical protein